MAKLENADSIMLSALFRFEGYRIVKNKKKKPVLYRNISRGNKKRIF